MAQTQRQRIIANAGKRRKGKRNAARSGLTAKQIRYFGTPAQKAALRKSKSAKRNKPKARKHHSATHRPKKVKRNTGEIIGYTLANAGHKSSRKPAKKGQHSMAKAKRKRAARKAPAGHRHSTKRRNTGGHKHRRRSTMARRSNRRRGGTRRNAGMFSGGVGGILTNAVFVIAGALGSKLLTQMVLGTNNTGMIGYAGNAVAGFGLWFLAAKVLKNAEGAKGIISGAAVQIVLRLINDYTPFGQYVSQLGMGDYQAQAFVTPQVLVDPYNSARIKIPGAWLPPPAPALTPSSASAAVGIGAYGGGDLYGGRSSLY
jgi:hypothetical protein